MRGMYFHNDGNEVDVGNFLLSLREDHQPVLEDLYIIANSSLETLDCRDLGGGIWEYSRALGAGRYAILLLTLLAVSDAYIVLHGFRAGREGTTRSDIRYARRVREAYK